MSKTEFIPFPAYATALSAAIAKKQDVIATLGMISKYLKGLEARYAYLSKVIGRGLHVLSFPTVMLDGADCELRPGDRSSMRCRSLRETNLVDNYRVANNLTFRALAAQLGISYQGAYNNCLRSPVNMKYVRTLCEHEGLSLAEFLDKYRSSGLPRTRSA